MIRPLFQPLDLHESMAGGLDLVPDHAIWNSALRASLDTLPGGSVALWNVPFSLPPADAETRWLWLGPGARDRATLTVGATAAFVVFAHFTLPSPDSAEMATSGRRPSGFVSWPGEPVADYVLEYADGPPHRVGVRRRFEIHDLITHWGQMAFVARPHRAETALPWRGPHGDGEWGANQTAAALPAYWGLDNSREPSVVLGSYWVYALENPRPKVPIERIRLASTGAAYVAVAGVTLFGGSGHPLRYGPIRALLLTQETANTPPPVTVELGTVAARYGVTPTVETGWVATEAGLGSPAPTSTGTEVIEVAAAEDAVLRVGDDTVSIADLLEDGPPRQLAVGSIQLLPPVDRRLEITIIDGSSGQTVAARVHFEALDGRYLPPQGHRHEVNDRWFEDYGADLKLGGTQYAYVDGQFRLDAPATDLLVEVVKGFEFAPLRRRVALAPGDTKVSLSLERVHTMRDQGWVSADTHVHFISPETAHLEAQAEGVDIVNILAAQWGDLFTNIGDYTGALAGASTRDTLIWVGTENRQHMLGHLSMLGIHGQLSSRLSSGGPSESPIGDPVWNPLSQWADECHAREGLVVMPHFPNPQCEVVADVVLGKIDAIEVRDFWWGVDSHSVREWYRLLNCGFRVTAVGGTDKMSAGMPVGGVRTYARIGDQELTYETWADAVRGGRTVTTSGPLLDLVVDGRAIGDDVVVGQHGRFVEVEATAEGVHELTALEVIHNGTVVARRDAKPGSRQLRLSERLRVASGWLAARAWGPGTAQHVWPVRIAAHTSPVYLSGPRLLPSRDDVAYLTAILGGGKEWLRTLATGTPEELRRAQAVFDEASTTIARLASRRAADTVSDRHRKLGPSGSGTKRLAR